MPASSHQVDNAHSRFRSKERLKYVVPLLERCFEDVRTKDGFHTLPNSIRTYVALCLIGFQVAWSYPKAPGCPCSSRGYGWYQG